MISLMGKEKQGYSCPKCSKEVDNAWVLKYESFGYTKYLYLCSNCGYVFKIQNSENHPELIEKTPIEEFPFSL
jgi:uncharacterized Zn finger protein